MNATIRSAIFPLIMLSAVACSSSSKTGDAQGGPDSAGATPDAAITSTEDAPAASGGKSTGPGNPSGGASGTGGMMGTGGKSTGTGGAASSGGAASTGGKSTSNGGDTSSGGAFSTGGKSTSNGGATSSGGAFSTGGITSTGPTAQQILDKVAACGATATVAKGGFGLDGGKGNISIYQCQGALYWKADMDVDCDGILTPPCDTDVTGQPQTSIVDDAPSGDVDATKLPYFVIPLGDPGSAWYKSFNVDLGQVGAVIYKDSVRYGIFADEAGGSFIGEASYAMCQLFLGKPTGGKDPCDPNQGGIDPADVTYVTFTGASNRATGSAIYSHDTHSSLGAAAASRWVSH
jgi:hypothetical protein